MSVATGEKYVGIRAFGHSVDGGLVPDAVDHFFNVAAVLTQRNEMNVGCDYVGITPFEQNESTATGNCLEYPWRDLVHQTGHFERGDHSVVNLVLWRIRPALFVIGDAARQRAVPIEYVR